MEFFEILAVIALGGLNTYHFKTGINFKNILSQRSARKTEMKTDTISYSNFRL